MQFDSSSQILHDRLCVPFVSRRYVTHSTPPSVSVPRARRSKRTSSRGPRMKFSRKRARDVRNGSDASVDADHSPPRRDSASGSGPALKRGRAASVGGGSNSRRQNQGKSFQGTRQSSQMLPPRNSHHMGSVRNDRSVPTPTISVTSGGLSPYWIATIEAPICGAIADSNRVTRNIPGSSRI